MKITVVALVLLGSFAASAPAPEKRGLHNEAEAISAPFETAPIAPRGSLGPRPPNNFHHPGVEFDGVWRDTPRPWPQEFYRPVLFHPDGWVPDKKPEPEEPPEEKPADPHVVYCSSHCQADKETIKKIGMQACYDACQRFIKQNNGVLPYD